MVKIVKLNLLIAFMFSLNLSVFGSLTRTSKFARPTLNVALKKIVPNPLQVMRSYSSYTLVPWLPSHKDYKPVVIDSADKSTIIDDRSNWYTDWTSGLMVTNVGHNNEYVKNAIKSQLDTGLAYVPPSLATPQREILSKRLVDMTGLDGGKVFFTLGGADANETAMFIAVNYFREAYYSKRKILTFQNSFHGGSTLVASLMGGDSRRSSKENMVDAPVYPIMPNPRGTEFLEEDLAYIEDILNAYQDEVAAIKMEGHSGSAGIIAYPEGYLAKVVAMARERNILVIMDEVMSGFGRTGKMFGWQHHDAVIPDIVTMAKGLTSGYQPLGATVVNHTLANFYNTHPLLTGLTYSGHPVSCAAANACLDLYSSDNSRLIQEAATKGDYIKLKLKYLQSQYPELLQEVRMTGMLGALVFNESFRGSPIGIANMVKFNKLLLKNHIFAFQRNNFVFMAPPLIITYDEIDYTLDRLENTIIEFLDHLTKN